MSETNDGETALAAAEVAAWLEAHPDFLDAHPEVVAALELRHETRAGTSLIEHQVSVLRDQVAALRRKLSNYHESAEANEALFRRVHDLYLAMIAADSPAALIALVRERLVADFGCDAVVLGRVDGAPAEGLADLSPVRERLREVLVGGEPVCGRFAADRLELLFGPEEAPTIRSAALVPWGVPAAGLLALGSEDERRFHAGMGTLFLAFLGQMFGQRLATLHGTAA